MKKIEAIIRPFKLDEVKASLGVLLVAGITIGEVQECGLGSAPPDRYRTASGPSDSAPKVKLEIITEDDKAVQVASAIERVACTGRGGDGTITILSVDDAVRIRTGERGTAAV